jgi:ribonuclease BN (tRNA processing enzyme)
MKLTLLGTGTPEPSLKRQSSGYVVEIGDDVLILDNGPGAYHRLLEAGFRATDPTHVFFTHFHYDHFIEYPRIVLQRWDQAAGRLPELEVFGPQPLAQLTDKLFGEQGVFEPDLIARTENASSLFVFGQRGGTLPRLRPQPAVHELSPGDTVERPGWKVRVAEAWHFQPQLACYGYRIEADGAVLCYSGDNGARGHGIAELARGADVLVHMMQWDTALSPSDDFRERNGTHMDVARLAHEAGVAKLIVTHIGHQIDDEATRDRLLGEMSKAFRGEIVWGEDLMSFEIAAR